MLSTRSYRTRYSTNFTSTVNLATRVLFALALAVVACCLLSIPGHAQALSLGTFTTNGSPTSCNDGAHFYYYVYPNTGLALDMTCQAATVGGCSQMINGQTITPDAWNVTIGYLNPVGVVPGVSVAQGLVVSSTAGTEGLCRKVMRSLMPTSGLDTRSSK